MFRQFRTVSMMLLLLGGSTGAVYAANPDVAGMYDTQQSSVCKGVVNDAFGPVIGASVVVKGSTNGVITDIDGNFSLSGVKEGDIIQISFVGYKTVEQVWNEKLLNISLQEDSELLEEVVVVGYGDSQKRVALTTAISKMGNKVLENAAFSNVGQTLQGSVTGLRVVDTSGQPGESHSIISNSR